MLGRIQIALNMNYTLFITIIFQMVIREFVEG
jgi:hypothetical protein